ncbi:Major facilitator superfamily domain, general substrate transporter, partial [Metarhizium majus ARSEF 297]
MALANEAIEEIGMKKFQWKLFWLNGFGYAVNSKQYGRPIAQIFGIPMASQIGLLVGDGLWGFSADVIGRKLAFNTSLFSSAVLVIIASGMPSYIYFASLYV